MRALTAAVVLGGVWTAWHLPAFLLPGVAEVIFPPSLTLLPFACFAIPATVLINWLYINSRSLLLAVLFHFGLVLQLSSLESNRATSLVWMGVICFAVAAAVVIWRYGADLKVRQSGLHACAQQKPRLLQQAGPLGSQERREEVSSASL